MYKIDDFWHVPVSKQHNQIIDQWLFHPRGLAIRAFCGKLKAVEYFHGKELEHVDCTGLSRSLRHDRPA